MDKLILTALALFGSALASCAEDNGAKEENETRNGAKTLVAYFSCTGNTKGVAEKIADAAGGDLWEIEPAEPYTASDLDYGDSGSRTSKEQNDPSARPALKEKMATMAGYDVVYLGYPIWWGIAPRIILTFLESHDLAGKTVIPFCTSGSSGIGSSAADLRSLAPDATWETGRRFPANASKSDVEAWVESVQPKTTTQGTYKMEIKVNGQTLTATMADNSSAGIGDAQSTANVVATKVYTIDGKALAGHDSTGTLPKGSYIVKTTYNDGTTTTRKITL